MLKNIIVTVVISCLTACSTMKSSETIADEKKNIKIAQINIQLGVAYLSYGNVQRAKQKLLYALKKAPQLPEAWYTMAYFQESTGNYREARIDYLKAIQLAPKRGDVHNNYGTFLCRRGQYTDSIQYFLLAVKDPNYLDVASAYENAGLCSLKIPNRAQAKYFFKQSLKEDSSRQTPLVELKKLDNR